MQFDCPRKEFSEAVAMAAAVASTRTTLPIYTNLKIEATDQGIRIVGSDQELWVERKTTCMVSEPGSACLAAKTLNEIVNAMPDGDIHLEVNELGVAKLTQGASEYVLQTMDPADFVEPPELPEETSLKLPMSVLRKAIDSVTIAVSPDPHRQVLTGVLFTTEENRLRLVATDTHRLCVRTIPSVGGETKINAIVPEKALKAIKALPLSDEDEIELKFGNAQIGAEVNGAKVVSQLLQGQFPNWQRVVPSESTRTWTVEVDKLTETLKRVMIIARDSASRIRFKGEDGQIFISAHADEHGEAKEELAMISDNGDISIAFNGKYVQEVLGVLGGAGVKIEMTESARAALFKPAESEPDFICVIMPMQL